ncbi:FkbM family methyltransferase [Yeosuana sp. MJ-SS3]|uniref:FkbM family methyltransferase n=1 Tax=Gilvirhabdus luticola TaxID=3079858 RepID=A0ABU3U4H1_9FLAO|nr:FkbM family methyltransferase [Yeosuana sp. MJ-SS3]MDU8885310.1 FkbM family methyltransferase [Yeosuana sp. MJ-SS3]
MKSLIKKILEFFNFTIARKINGTYFKIPILGSLGFSNLSVNEKWMIDVLKIILQIDSVKFIDVGANIGQTLLKLKSIDKNIEYIGFEPNPNCIFYLRTLIKKNSIKNVVLVPIGISTKNELGELNFYIENYTDSSASILENFRENKILRKEFISLFDVKNIKNKIDFNDISFLKVDVEGAELEVIESFKDEIKNHNPFILLEILPIYNIKENPNRSERQNKLLSILKNLHYSAFRIIKTKEILLSLKEIDRIEVHSNLNHCDYIFVPIIKLNEFKSLANNLLSSN